MKMKMKWEKRNFKRKCSQFYNFSYLFLHSFLPPSTSSILLLLDTLFTTLIRHTHQPRERVSSELSELAPTPHSSFNPFVPSLSLLGAMSDSQWILEQQVSAHPTPKKLCVQCKSGKVFFIPPKTPTEEVKEISSFGNFWWDHHHHHENANVREQEKKRRQKLHSIVGKEERDIKLEWVWRWRKLRMSSTTHSAALSYCVYLTPHFFYAPKMAKDNEDECGWKVWEWNENDFL